MKDKTFKVSQIRELLNQVYTEKITFSRFVEILNEQASDKNKIEEAIRDLSDKVNDIRHIINK